MLPFLLLWADRLCRWRSDIVPRPRSTDLMVQPQKSFRASLGMWPHRPKGNNNKNFLELMCGWIDLAPKKCSLLSTSLLFFFSFYCFVFYLMVVKTLNMRSILLTIVFAVLGFEFRLLPLAWQVFYYLSHTPIPFCFRYFSGRVSCFFPGLASEHDSPTHVLLHTGNHSHHVWLINWYWISQTFCPS
jgi:hypothetical protein